MGRRTWEVGEEALAVPYDVEVVPIRPGDALAVTVGDALAVTVGDALTVPMRAGEALAVTDEGVAELGRAAVALVSSCAVS